MSEPLHSQKLPLDNGYILRLAHRDDEAAIIAVEVAASDLFLTIGFPPLAGVPDHLPPATIQAGIAASRLWVVTTEAADVVGFALAGYVDDHAHLFEVDVHPAHGRRGIGRLLIDQVAQWALAHNHTLLTLTTFCDVPWNGPFYRRLGFVDLDIAAMSPELLGIFKKEIAENTLARSRCAMGKSLDQYSLR